MAARLLKFALRALDGAARLLPASRRPAQIPKHQTGTRGEELAYFHLRELGYVMVARNYRTALHRSEIDLVGWEGEVLCFVEVKTRSTRDVATAEAAVDEEKRRDLRRVARHFLRRTGGEPATRFDIVSVYLDVSPPEINVYRGAFGL